MQALEGIRVLDLGTFIAGPFCATVLGEFGAEVIKVERPGTGDHTRRFGTDTACGDTLVWLSEGRNKRSVTLDLGQPQGRELLRELITTADIVIENFRPGVLERWGLGPDAIEAINPRTILVRISAYGQTGPMSDQPGFARIAHAFSGLAYLAGEPDGPPVTPGSTSLADYMTGLYGVVGTLLALRAREETGTGQVVDLALYEPIFRVLDELAPAFQQFGIVRERMGADTVNVLPHSHYECRTARGSPSPAATTTCSPGSPSPWAAPSWRTDGAWGPKQRRLADRDEVNRVVAAWVRTFTREDVLATCRSFDVPAGPLNSIADIFEDPQYAHRETIVEVPSRIGPLKVPGTVPALSGTPGEIKWLGQELGADTDAVLGELLHRTTEQIAQLRADGVV